MYIVSQCRDQIINSDHVTKFYIDITRITIAGDPNDYEVAAIMADAPNEDIYLRTQILKELGHYDSRETAQKILKLLLYALQDGTGTFYMPQP